jgi:hypothetical protein
LGFISPNSRAPNMLWVGLPKKIVELGLPRHAELAPSLLRQAVPPRVDHVHLERTQALHDLAADTAETDRPTSLPDSSWVATTLHSIAALRAEARADAAASAEFVDLDR